MCVFVKLVHTTVSCKDAGSILYNENYPSPLGSVFLTTSASLGRVSACLFFWGGPSHTCNASRVIFNHDLFCVVLMIVCLDIIDGCLEVKHLIGNLLNIDKKYRGYAFI